MSTEILLLKKFKSKFMRNTGWLLFEQIFRMILALLVTSQMARYLGAHNYGLLNYGVAYIAIFMTLSKLGIDSIIVHEIIKNRKNTGEIVGTTIVLRSISSLISILMIYVLVVFLNPNEKMLHVITIIQSLSLIFVAFDVVGFWFQSNLQSKYAVISKSIAFTLVSIWRIILIYFEAPVEYFAFATVLEAITISAFMVVFYIKFNGQKLSFSFQVAKKLLIRSSSFIISGLLVSIYTQMDKIMLGKIADESTVGIYSAAMTIASLWIFVPNALIESARPVIMSTKESNEKLYLLRYKQLLCSIIWLSIFASLFISLLSKPLVLIIFGDQFTESIFVLAVLIWSRIFALIGVTRSIWLISENQVKYQIYFVGVGAFLNVILNFVLIPKYGAMGAAIATIFAEVLSSTVALLFFKKTRPLFKLIIEAFIFKGITSRS